MDRATFPFMVMRIELGQVPPPPTPPPTTPTPTPPPPPPSGSRVFYCPVVSLEVARVGVGAEAEAGRQRGGQHGRGVVLLLVVDPSGGLLDGVLERPHEREEERLVGLWSRIQRCLDYK